MANFNIHPEQPIPLKKEWEAPLAEEISKDSIKNGTNGGTETVPGSPGSNFGIPG